MLSDSDVMTPSGCTQPRTTTRAGCRRRIRTAANLPHMPALEFLTQQQVADELNTSVSQVYAVIRRKELRALKLGGRGQWRISRADLEDYISRLYDETSDWIDLH